MKDALWETDIELMVSTPEAPPFRRAPLVTVLAPAHLAGTVVTQRVEGETCGAAFRERGLSCPLVRGHECAHWAVTHDIVVEAAPLGLSRRSRVRPA